MIVNRVTFTGEHRGRPATVVFDHVVGGWKVAMNVGGKVITAQTGPRVKPCVTHAGYLLDEHFPNRLLEGVRKLRGRKPKHNAHRATVVESSFVETKTGARLRVVRNSP